MAKLYLGIMTGVSEADANTAVIMPEQLFIDDENYIRLKTKAGVLTYVFARNKTSETDIVLSSLESGSVVIRTLTTDGETTVSRLETRNLAYAIPQEELGSMSDGEVRVMVVKAVTNQSSNQSSYTVGLMTAKQFIGYEPADVAGDTFDGPVILSRESSLTISSEE